MGVSKLYYLFQLMCLFAQSDSYRIPVILEVVEIVSELIQNTRLVEKNLGHVLCRHAPIKIGLEVEKFCIFK